MAAEDGVVTFDHDAWRFAGEVARSQGYSAWLAWMMQEMPAEWLNGLAAHVTHQRSLDRTDLKRETIIR